MKKTKIFYAAAIMMACAFGMQSCSIDDNPSDSIDPVKTILGAIKDGATFNDLIANYVEDNTLTLPEGAVISIEDAVERNAPLTIITDGEKPATIIAKAGIKTNSAISFENVVIDADEVTTPFIQLADVTLEGEELAKVIDVISFTNTKLSNLKYQLIYANKQSYLIKAIKVENSIIGVDGTNKKTIFDFNGGGNTGLLSINNSTIYANPTNGQNGGFFSTQSGKEVTDLGGETWAISITNSTLYNIANGKTVNTLRKNSQAYQKYFVKNNIVVDCGKSGQFLKGLNAGQAGKDENWDVDGNCFNFGGKFIQEQKIGSTEDNIKNNIEADVVFADAENGDFTQSNAQAGDPRWIK
jgi:hypothetical protein